MATGPATSDPRARPSLTPVAVGELRQDGHHMLNALRGRLEEVVRAGLPELQSKLAGTESPDAPGLDPIARRRSLQADPDGPVFGGHLVGDDEGPDAADVDQGGPGFAGPRPLLPRQACPICDGRI